MTIDEALTHAAKCTRNDCELYVCVLAQEVFRLRAEAKLREHYLEVERDATELARLERDEARDMRCSKFAPQVVIVNTPPELQQQIVDAVRRVQRAEVIEIWSSE